MSDATPERWLPVVGYEDWYEVSNLGRVRSWYTFNPKQKRRQSPQVLKGHVAGTGYRVYALYANCESSGPVGGHTLVAAAFIGPRPVGMDVCHFNGDPLDNRLANLRYDTPKGNGADKVRHGRSLRGSKNAYHKLTEAEVLAIRKARPTSTLAKLAKEYGVAISTIHAAAAGKNWSWLPDEALGDL